MIDIEEKEPKVFDNEPKEITIEDAKKYFNAKYLDNSEVYDTGASARLEAGVKGFIGSLKKLPSQLRMAGGQAMFAQGETMLEKEGEWQGIRERVLPKGDRIFNGNLGVKVGEKLKESGKYNIMTANRNIETLNREIQNNMPNLSEEDRNSWTMMIAEQGLDYGVMLGLSYINPALGMGYMGTKIFGQETEEGAEAYKRKYGTIEGFENLSGEELTLNVANTAVQEVIEKAFGAPAQIKRFKTMKDFGKAFLTGFGEEFITENLQNVSDAVFDHIGKRLDEDETVLTQIMDNFKGTLVAGMFGGTAGTAFAIHNRAQGINNFEKLLDGSDVAPEDRNALATDLYESGVNNLQSIVTKELELNSQLRAKHGEVYDTIKAQIDKQARAVGAYEGKTEAEIAQYLESTAKEQADHVLAEAQLRNTLVDDVLNSSDIVFENGRLYLKELTDEQKKVKERKKKKKSAEEVAAKENELKTQIEENAPAEAKEQNLNDVVSSYDGAENFDVEAMPTDEKQAVFEAEQQVKDSIVPTERELTYDEIVRKLRYEELSETQEEELKDRLDEEEERLKPLFDTANDVALDIDKEFDLILTDIAESISENRLNFQEAEKLFGDYLPVNDLRELGEKIKERDNIQGDPVKIGYDYFTERVYEAYDEKQAQEKNFTFELPERASPEPQTEITPETNEAIQEETLPEVEKEDTATSDKIEDFGEYLYGARKDLWQGFKNKLNESLPDDAEDIKLSVVFPEPNYEKAIANGVDVNALATIKALRDMIPAKPKYAYKLERWKDLVMKVRAIASQIVNNNFDMTATNEMLKSPEFAKINNAVKLYQMLGYPYFTKAKGYTLENTYYHKYNGDDWVMTNIYHEGDKVGYKIEKDGRNSYFFENINDGIDEIKSRINLDKATQGRDKKVKFDLYYKVGERNKIILGKKIRSGKYLDMHTFDSVKEAREYLTNNYDSLVAELEKLKQNPMDRGEVNQARIGDDYRNGNDVTPDMFADMFGFRGVQFGNWVEQKKRTSDLNEAYDALIDLSKVLNVPTRALSLNGTLGLAFGARGHSGALAHYEPDSVVINLTKMQGAGSLGHEWFHALDNSFMKKDNKWGSFATEEAMTENPLSHNRPEVMLAFFELRKALQESKIFERSAEWDKAKKDDYWSSIRELGARTFEQYAKDKLAERGVTNDFLVNILAPEDNQSVYLLQDEKTPIYAAYDKLFNTLKTRETEKGVEFYQGKKGKIKGAFDKLTKSIRITKDADFSTYQHEFAHFWLDNIWDYVNSGKASEEYVKRFNEIKKWLGVKPNQDYFTREQHEKFARGYEKFLYEGKAVNPIIASAFDDYEKFIRDVYDDVTDIDTRAGEKYEPLSREAYNFFNSMVSGELTPPANLPDETTEQARETVAKSETDAEEVVAEETKILEENRANYKLEPVKTDTKTSYLTAYEKMTGEKVEAGVAELDKEMAKANEFVANNLELAEKIVNGEAPAPENMLKNTIYLAYQEMQKKLGNTQKRANALLNQAQELRAYGQEIASQKLAYADQSTPLYWLSRVMSARAESIAEGNKMTASELQDYINKEIRPAIGDEKAVENVVKTLAENLGIRELYQTEKVDFSTKDGVYKYVTSKLGIIPTQEQTAEIIKRADDMLNNLKNAQTNGNPTVDYFVKYKDLENYANSIAPSSNLRVLVSVVGKGNLLASFKSPTTNIVANMPVAGLQAALRRQKLGVTKSIVDAELIKQNKKQSWEIYRKTGYQLNNMTDVSPKGMTLGERITQSQGEGAIRKLGRIYENVVYKWSLGAPDLLYKDFAFNDYVSLAATKESGGDIAKANEIYKDAIKIMPETELGQEIRQAAIEDSLIATYQNNGKISEAALKIRKSLDFGVGFGEFIAPFVKTPANVVGMGLDTAFGGVRALTSEIIRDVKAGKVLTPKSENVRLVVQNGLGLLVASLLLGAIDDDDYMPSYSLATNRDKQIAKELNIPFNSIRIGNTWFSMDYLGPLASPLMGLLQARRENGIINSVMGYVKSGAIQTLSIPAFGNVGDLNEKISNIVRKDGVDALENVASQAIEATVARAVPSIVSDISKMLDENDREAKTLKEKLQAKTPLLREELPERYNVTTGKAMPRAENTVKRLLIDLFAGARVKEQVVNDMADELFRLNTKGYGASLTDVTRSGLLSKVDSEKKALIKKDFAQMYSKGVKELIKTYRYKKADDEDKKDMIDSLRRKYVKELKNKYLKKAKR